MAAIDVTSLSLKLGGAEILKDITFSLEEGEIMGIIGPNGCGKSTLIKAVIGILKPDKGRVSFQGLKSDSAGRKIMGYAPQENSYFEKLTVLENVAYFGDLYGLDSKKVSSAAKEICSYLGLSKKLNAMAESLSGGQKRRLNIACAMLHDPKILILDEPTVNVDPASRLNLLNLIRNINRRGTSILIASNLMEDVRQICDRVMIMGSGRIIVEGPTDKILSRYSVERIFGGAVEE